MNDDIADKIIAKLNDLQRQINAIARLDVLGTATLPSFSGTPTAGALAYWTGAGTVAGAGTAFYDAVNGRVGVGASDPTSQLEVTATNTAAARGFITGQHNSSAAAALFYFQKSRNTRASPATVNNGDFPGVFYWQAHDGTNYLATAAIAAKVTGSVGTGTVPTDLIFVAGNDDDLGLTNERMRIKSTGLVGIGETTPTGQLHVEQASTTGAIPTLWLRQSDVSEEMIRFESTVGAGNTINTTALGVYYGRVRVYVEGVGAKWLALYD